MSDKKPAQVIDLMAALRESLASRKEPCRHGTPPKMYCEKCVLNEPAEPAHAD